MRQPVTFLAGVVFAVAACTPAAAPATPGAGSKEPNVATLTVASPTATAGAKGTYWECVERAIKGGATPQQAASDCWPDTASFGGKGGIESAFSFGRQTDEAIDAGFTCDTAFSPYGQQSDGGGGGGGATPAPSGGGGSPAPSGGGASPGAGSEDSTPHNPGQGGDDELVQLSTGKTLDELEWEADSYWEALKQANAAGDVATADWLGGQWWYWYNKWAEQYEVVHGQRPPSSGYRTDPNAENQCQEILQEIANCIATGWRSFSCRELKSMLNGCASETLVIHEGDYCTQAYVDPKTVERAWTLACESRKKYGPGEDPCGPRDMDGMMVIGADKGDPCGSPVALTDPEDCTVEIQLVPYGEKDINEILSDAFKRLGGPIFVIPTMGPQPGLPPKAFVGASQPQEGKPDLP